MHFKAFHRALYTFKIDCIRNVTEICKEINSRTKYRSWVPLYSVYNKDVSYAVRWISVFLNLF